MKLVQSSSLRSNARVGFALAFVCVQVVLVATADARPDNAFGFRMFSESSTISYSLSRELRDAAGNVRVVRAPDGEWSAHDRYGVLRHVSWRERVRHDELSTFDMTFHAAYSAKAQVSRLAAALTDVASHTPDDHETVRLLLDVTIRRNGRDPEVFHFASPPRL